MLAILAQAALAAPLSCAPASDDARAALQALRAENGPDAVAARRQTESGPADLARARAAAVATGIPLDPARLQRRPVAPALDAAPLYVRLGRLRRPNRADSLDLSLDPPNPRYAYTPAQIARVRRSLGHQREALSLAHQAASRPYCVFRRDWSRGQEVLLSEYQYQGAAVRLLRTEAYLWARDGHPTEAIRNAVLVLHVADQFASDPTMSGYLGSQDIEAKGLDVLADVLEVSHGNPQTARQVLDIMATRLPHRSLWYAAAGEFSSWLITLDSLRMKWEPGWAWDVQSGRLVDLADPTPDRPVVAVSPEEHRLLAGLWDAWEAHLLTDTARQVTLLRAGTPPQNIVPGPSAVRGWADRVLRLPGGPLRNPLLAGLGEVQKRGLARKNVLRTAAALLADPAHPLRPLPDPFTGRPLGFRREGRRGFVVYSVGEDGTFRGGHSNDPPVPWTILFRFPAPKPSPLPEFYDWL